MAGMIKGEVKGFEFENGSNSWNVPIEFFADYGDFVAFTPDYSSDDTSEISSEGGNKGQHMLNYVSGFGLGKDNNYYEYLLSKKSGKIYQVYDNYDSDDSVEFNIFKYIPGSEILYANIEKKETGEQYWAIISEENDQLKITKSNMLEFLSNDYGDISEDDCYFDKYGNALKGYEVYGYNQKKIQAGFVPGLSVQYNDYLGIIYRYFDGSFYVLEGLEFKKYDDIIFGYLFSFTGHEPSNYCYYLNENGDYEIHHDENESYDSSTLYAFDGKNEGMNNDSFKKGYMKDVHVYEDYHVVSENIFGEGYGLFKKTGEYTYVPLKRSGLTSLNDEAPIFRDNFVYCLNGSDLTKYDFVNDSTIKIDCGDYQIKKISEDSRGNIVLTGYDPSFKEFKGYLNEDDEVSFEPVNDSQYDVIYMNPIN